jgi:ketosteroid isomerase-like protein
MAAPVRICDHPIVVNRHRTDGLPPTNVALVTAAFDAFAERDAAALTALCSVQVRVDGPTASVAGDGRPYVGHLGLAYYLADVGRAWETLELEPARFIEARRDAVVVEGHVRAWGSGRVVDAPASWLWTVSDGKVESVRIFGSADGAAAAARSEGRPVQELDDQDS